MVGQDPVCLPASATGVLRTSKTILPRLCSPIWMSEPPLALGVIKATGCTGPKCLCCREAAHLGMGCLWRTSSPVRSILSATWSSCILISKHFVVPSSRGGSAFRPESAAGHGGDVCWSFPGLGAGVTVPGAICHFSPSEKK